MMTERGSTNSQAGPGDQLRPGEDRQGKALASSGPAADSILKGMDLASAKEGINL